jgi:hypothetical protein
MHKWILRLSIIALIAGLLAYVIVLILILLKH